MLEISLGDVFTLRKPHPCGGDTWIVVRLGADIGLECATCKRHILLERRILERRMKNRPSPTPILKTGNPIADVSPIHGDGGA